MTYAGIVITRQRREGAIDDTPRRRDREGHYALAYVAAGYGCYCYEGCRERY